MPQRSNHVVGFFLAAVTIYSLHRTLDSASLELLAVAGIAAYLLGVVLDAWTRITLFWYRRGTRGMKTWRCKGCERRIYRKPGDWILECKSCGWKPGLPGVRWVWHSVPVVQTRRRSLLGGTIRTIFAASLVVGLLLMPLGLTPVLASSLQELQGIVDDEPGTIVNSSPTTSKPVSETQSPTFQSVVTTPGEDAETPNPSSTATPIPIEKDTDGDGLNRSMEKELGTDPLESDTDGDGLSDYREAQAMRSGEGPIASADPLQKDLFVTISYTDGARELTQSDLNRLKKRWSSMSVKNPNGDTGIDIHIRVDRLTENVSIGEYQTPSEAQIKELENLYPRILDGCYRYWVVVDDYPTTTYSGRGTSPGLIAVVDDKMPPEYNYDVTITITHELLHNLVGTFSDGTTHTDSGYLRRQEVEKDPNLSEQTRDHLNTYGFAESEYFQDVVC